MQVRAHDLGDTLPLQEVRRSVMRALYKVTHGQGKSSFFLRLTEGQDLRDEIDAVLDTLYVAGQTVHVGIWRVEGGGETFVNSMTFRMSGGV